MEKQFQEVFPDLRIEGGMAELLDTVEVSRVSIHKKKDLLRIYVVSHQWIHKKYIYQLERQIEEQLFSNVPLRVKIIERFYLSRQYTPENFLEVYRPSILLELKNHSVFLNHLFSTAEITFPETNKMHLVLVDSVVAKEREEELVHILEKIFCERCGFDLIVETEMRKPEGESRAMRNSELRIREEVRHVLAHTHYGEMLGEKEQNRMEEQAEAAKPKPVAKENRRGSKALREENDKLKERCQDAEDKYKRLLAECENIRQRNEKESSKMYDFGAKDVLGKLLPVVDNFERAIAAIPEEDKDRPFEAGVDKIYKSLMTSLESIGVTPMNCEGEQFDPAFHNAVMHVEDENYGENVIVEEMQRGYMYKDQVLRFSMVKVAN